MPVVEVPKTRVQRLRFFSQIFSVLVNLWIGVKFYLFVRYVESGGETLHVSRPPGVEGWLPIGALVSFRHWIETGIINDVHPAGLIILFVILLVAFLFKKGFCGWICPVGFISEMLGDMSDRIWKRRLKPPPWLDWPLRMLKYLLLGSFLYAIFYSMSSDSIKDFLYSDYNKTSDILMLEFFTDITMLSLSVIAGLFVLSLIVRGFWCRYLCPYGALLGLLGLISPTRIKRQLTACIDCSSCRHVCPAFIKVDTVREVISDECIGCLACVDSCPSETALTVRFVSAKWEISPIRWALILIAAFWLSLAAAKFFGPWDNAITETEYFRHLPSMNKGQYLHP